MYVSLTLYYKSREVGTSSTVWVYWGWGRGRGSTDRSVEPKQRLLGRVGAAVQHHALVLESCQEGPQALRWVQIRMGTGRFPRICLHQGHQGHQGHQHMNIQLYILPRTSSYEYTSIELDTKYIYKYIPEHHHMNTQSWIYTKYICNIYIYTSALPEHQNMNIQIVPQLTHTYWYQYYKYTNQ